MNMHMSNQDSYKECGDSYPIS